jgi:aminoglycoside phosphotransferase family enzyme/predicted kinase
MAEAEQDEAIAFLSDPDRAGLGPVEMIETHGSMVFLTADRAYKMKKAVRYSYLDYSTLALRKAACAAELAINARFAPSLYLDTQPITREADGKLALDGAGSPIEWLVVMRRFDGATQFDRLAQTGGLTPALMRQLADQIAAAHDQATPTQAFGDAPGYRRIYDNIARDLRAFVAEGLPGPQVELWADRALAALEAQGPLLERRRLDGRVRPGHGDLHLANICLVDGAATLFDAIEFDPALSTIDLLYDLAFLLMDLWSRGMRREANELFNRYLDLRDEGDGMPALPLFLSLRAAIRAQVTFAATLNAHSAEGIEAKRAASRAYLDLAVDLLRPTAPRLIAIGGVSGTGKSTLARALAPELGSAPGARVLRSDVLRKRAFGVAPETRLPPEAYAPEGHRLTYGRLLMELERMVGSGLSVIADAVFGRPEERDEIEAAAARSGAPFIGLWLTAPQAALEERVAARTGDASDATVAVLRAQIADINRPTGWIELDASDGPEATVTAGRAAVGAA